MSGNHYLTDHQLKRDAMRYSSAEIKKLKTAKQMMDKLSMLLDNCKADNAPLSAFPYSYELSEHLVSRLNHMEDEGKLNTGDVDRWKDLKRKYYDYIMGL